MTPRTSQRARSQMLGRERIGRKLIAVDVGLDEAVGTHAEPEELAVFQRTQIAGLRTGRRRCLWRS